MTIWPSILGSSSVNMNTSSASLVCPSGFVWTYIHVFCLYLRHIEIFVFLYTRYRQKDGSEPVPMVHVIFSFDVVLTNFYAVKVRSSFCTLGDISWASYLRFGNSLYRWKTLAEIFLVMLVFSLDAAPDTFYLVFFHFHILVDILVVLGLMIDFVLSDDSSWVVLSIVSALCLFLVFVDIICMHSYKHTDIKYHIPSIFLFHLFCLVLHFDSRSVIWAHSCRLLYPWDSLYLIPYCTYTTLIKVPWGVDVLPWFSIFLCPSSVSSVTLASWRVWDWSPQYTHMYYFVHLDHGSLTCNSFDPIF